MQKGYSWIQGDGQTLPKHYGQEESAIVATDSPFIDVDTMYHNLYNQTKKNLPFWLAIIFEAIWTCIVFTAVCMDFRTNCAGYVSSFWASIFYITCQDPVHVWLIGYIIFAMISAFQALVLISKGFKPGMNRFNTPQPDTISLPVFVYYFTLFWMTIWIFTGIVLVTHLPEADPEHSRAFEHTVAVMTVCFYWIFLMGVRLIANEKF